jgi:hypothetical protein
MTMPNSFSSVSGSLQMSDRARFPGPLIAAAALIPILAGAQPATSDHAWVGVGLEFGPVSFSRNDVRIPGNGGSNFDMRDLTGSGPETFARLDAYWDISDRHGLRVVLAPLQFSGTGALAADTDFAGTMFPAGTTDATYEFSTYKFTYRYAFAERGGWRWRLGFTGLIRDANVALQRGALSANDDDFGFVPLLHVYGEYEISDRWGFEFDFDGLAGGPGRAFDVSVQVHRDVGRNWRIGAGYRVVEGGVDTDDVYNFAWLNYAVLRTEYRF